MIKWPTNYFEAQGILQSRTHKRLSKNTDLTKEHDCIVLELHGHPIVIYRPDSITISSCGWPTVTTKRRLNQCSPFTVWQKDFEWYVDIDGKTFDFEDDTEIEL